jgi:hypothetical protein
VGGTVLAISLKVVIDWTNEKTGQNPLFYIFLSLFFYNFYRKRRRRKRVYKERVANPNL